MSKELNQIKAEAVMQFVDMLRGAFGSGAIDNNPTVYDIYSSAQNHVKLNYGHDSDNWDDHLADFSRNEKYNFILEVDVHGLIFCGENDHNKKQPSALSMIGAVGPVLNPKLHHTITRIHSQHNRIKRVVLHLITNGKNSIETRVENDGSIVVECFSSMSKDIGHMNRIVTTLKNIGFTSVTLEKVD